MLQVIKDYETPPQKEFSRGLEAELQPSVAFLDCCRPLSVSMTNALRFLMWQLTQLPNNVSDSEVMSELCMYSALTRASLPRAQQTYEVKSVSNASGI